MKITVKHFVEDVGVEISVEDSELRINMMQEVCAALLTVANGKYAQYIREQAAGVVAIPVTK